MVGRSIVKKKKRSSNKKKNSKIVYAKNDGVKDEWFLPENVKLRISIFIPEDVLTEFRKEAKKKNMGYQTLMNQVLRQHITKEETLEDRIVKLEKVVFKKG